MTLKRTANITELAAQLSLSKGTVSRILNDPTAPFAAETRRRVLSLAGELGYRPNPIARALATGRTGSVALWIRNLSTSYRARVAQAFESQNEAEAYRLLIRLYGREPGRAETTALLLPEIVDGIVTHGPPPEDWLQRNRATSKPVPIVFTGVIADQDAPDWVGVDMEPASRQAVGHLLTPGRRRVAHVTMYPAEWAEGDRTRAYRQVMTEAGLAPEFIRSGGETRGAIRETVREYVRAHGCPEALFCINDDAAIASYRALCDLGLRVPDDVALVGCDGIEDTEYMPAPITTIMLPIDEMCHLAWRYLEHRLQDPETPPQRIVLQPTLIIRESSSGGASC